jgi:asparagine synthase (glutamine-hydrolysing)
MCGIVGVWNLSGAPVDAHDVLRMRDALTHRGPDDAGLFVDGPVALGHRRLSIIDLSDAGRMPMGSPDGGVQAVFNGEVYNFRELRKELRARGHRFESETDSEVVLRAYEEWGAGCFERFNGMFAVAIWDAQRRRMVLGRDPAGQKPLYFAHRPRRWLLVASTLAPLIAYAGSELGVDQKAVNDYVRFGFPPHGRAMLEDVRTVQPGSVVIVDEGKEPVLHRYFDLTMHAEQASPRKGDERELVEELRDLMRSAVRTRLVSDVPLGAFLSGGVDSSLIVALMAEHEREAVKT